MSAVQHLSKSNVYDMGQLERTLLRENAWPVSIAAMLLILAILNIKLQPGFQQHFRRALQFRRGLSLPCQQVECFNGDIAREVVGKFL